MNEKTIIISGAGVAGLSTALAAIDRGYEVYLIDDPSPSLVPASQGLQRIIRASYDNEVYQRLASKGLQLIKNGPLSENFTESKRKVLEPGGTGVERKTFRDIKFEDLVGQYDDQPAGRIDAADALARMKQMAVDSGVIFIPEKVTSIVWEGDICHGVRTKEVWNNKGDRTNEGSTYLAKSVILCMGYRVLEFLAGQGKPIQDDLCKIGLVSWGEVQLDDRQREEIEKKGIQIVPGVGEYLLATKNRLVVNNAKTAEVKDPEQVVRALPLQENSYLYKETHDLSGWFLPHLKDAPFKLHYCLDLVTRNQHFLVRPVPESRGLYMVGAFGFHGFKFGPVIGTPAMDMVEGKLDPELEKQWSGTMDGKEIHPEIMPYRGFGEGEI